MRITEDIREMFQDKPLVEVEPAGAPRD